MDERTGNRLSRRRVGQALVGGTLVIGFNSLTRAFGVSTNTSDNSSLATCRSSTDNC